jgi:hypothetical protein
MGRTGGLRGCQGSGFGGITEERWGETCPEDEPDWDVEHVLEHRGKARGYIRVIQDLAEGGFDVLFVQYYVAIRVPLVKTPDVNPMSQLGFSIVNCRVSLVVDPGLGHLGICIDGVTFEYRVGGIYDDPDFFSAWSSSGVRSRYRGRSTGLSGESIGGMTSPPLLKTWPS